MKERSTLVLSLVLLGGLAAGSYWLAEQAHMGDAAAKKVTHEPDAWVENFTLTRIDPKGMGSYAVSARRMAHFPDDDTAELEAPRLVSLQRDRARVNMRADQGTLTSGAVEVHLRGNVEIRRAPPASSSNQRAELILRTPALLVLPEQDVARTDQPVEMVQGDSRVTGRGMFFDNGKQLVQLNPTHLPGARVRATIAPNRPATRSESQPESKPESRPAAKPARRPATRPKPSL